MLLVTLGVLTWHQCGVYKDEETLYRDVLLKNPNSWMAYNNLGSIYSNFGRYEDATEAYKQALRIKPDFAMPYVGLGAIYSKLGVASRAEAILYALNHKLVHVPPSGSAPGTR